MNFEIVSLNDQGMGVTFVDNKITFVDKVVVGDIVTLDIIYSYSKYNIAKVREIVKKSPLRVDSFCPYFDKCGGCHLNNLSYDDTLKYKKEKLQRILHKFGNIDFDIDMVSLNNKNYRNKLTLQVKNSKIGLYENKTNNVIEIDKCDIVSFAINNFIKEIPNYNIINGQVVIRSNYNNELLIHFITDDKINIIKSNDNKIVGILQNNKLLMGEDHFIDKINNKLFQVSYDSFFQVNREIAGKIFDYIRDNIIQNKNVLDLYSGVGTLGLNVSDISNKIYGIEIVKNAVLNSLVNAKINKANNTKYMLGDASSLIDKIADNIDLIILDPPRSGLSNHEINVINKIKPEQIIYVSCDPITLARDLKLLNENYNIKFVKGFDMFAYTYHIETVCILERKII